MPDGKEDIFGKIDALLERRIGFGIDEGHKSAEDDFPLLTDVVDGAAGYSDRRQLNRRGSDRRLDEDRRHTDRRRDVPDKQEELHPTLSEEQFARFMGDFERKLEDLFILQQLRVDETLRRTVREEVRRLQGGEPD